MKFINIITQPFILILSFSLILINGEHWGGFYLLYILFALPHAGIHALLAISGALLVSIRPITQRWGSIEALLKLSGAVCMILSLYLFFHNDRTGYNDASFAQGMPLFTIILFGLLASVFMIYHLLSLIRKKYDPALTNRT